MLFPGTGGTGWGPLRWFAPGSVYDYERNAGDLWRNAAIAACLRVLKDNFPQPELQVVIHHDDGAAEVVPNHPIVELFNRPNPGYDRYNLWAAFVTSAVVDGNAYLLKIRGASRKPVELWWVPPWELFPCWPQDGSEWISHYEYHVEARRYVVPVKDVIHFRYGGLDPRNPRYGMSPLKAAAARSVCSLNEVDGYTAALLRNFGVPGVVIAPKSEHGSIQSGDAEVLTRQWRQRTSGEHRGDPFVSSAPIDVKPLSFSPEQLSLKSLPDRLEDQICALTGVNPMVAGLTSGAAHKTYNNMQEARRAVYEDTIIPMQAAVAECLEYCLLSDPGMGRPEIERIRFSYAGIQSLSEDQDRLAARAGLLFGGGLITRGQALEMIGVEPTPEDDVYVYEIEGLSKPKPTQPTPGGDPLKRMVNGHGNSNGFGQPRFALRQPVFAPVGPEDVEDHKGDGGDREADRGEVRSVGDNDSGGLTEGEQRDPFAAKAEPPPPLLPSVDPPDDEPENTFRLPGGEPIVKLLRRFAKEQRRYVLAWLDGDRTKDSTATPLPGDMPDLTIFNADMAEAMTPIITAYWDAAGQKTTASLGLDPATWQVTDPHLREKIDKLPLEFAASTNATTTHKLKDALDKLKDELVQGLVTEGEAVNVLRGRVQSIFTELSNERAELIARTEASRAVHAASVESARQSGVVEGKKIMLASDACEVCVAMADSVPERGVPLDGSFGTFGDHPTYSNIQWPPIHPRCRCSCEFVLLKEFSDVVAENPPETFEPGPLGPEPIAPTALKPVPSSVEPILPGRPIAERIEAYTEGENKRQAVIEAHQRSRDQWLQLVTERSNLEVQAMEILKDQARIISQYAETSTPVPASVAVQVSQLQDKIDERLRKAGAIGEQIKGLDAKLRDDVTAVLRVPEGARFLSSDVPAGYTTHSGLITPLSETTARQVSEVERWLNQITARGDQSEIKVLIGEQEGVRAHYSYVNKHIQIKKGEAAKIVAHEYGHAIDDQLTTGGQSVLARSLEFLEHRVGNEPLVDLKAKFGYGDAGEMGRKDRFDSVFDEYAAYYVGKDYGKAATEIVSMGLELLYNDPVKFANNDPEYFRFILGVLDGSLR